MASAVAISTRILIRSPTTAPLSQTSLEKAARVENAQAADLFQKHGAKALV